MASSPCQDVTVRAARLSDLAELVRFSAAMAEETERRTLDLDRLRQGISGVLTSKERGYYLVAETGSRVAGQLLLTYEWSDWRNGIFWWIQSVYVAEPLRGRGIFRALFEHVHALARGRPEVCGLRLYMDAHNAPARQTYERLGLQQTNYEV